ncbi:heavy metal-binding domain-containing protein [Guggenheimella bovis]
MIITTGPNVDGYEVSQYLDIVFGEVITGVNFLKDLGASFRNIFGGRSEGYESELLEARTQALEEMKARAQKLGADAVIAVDIDYEVLGVDGSMLMATASGTAVKLVRK